MKVNGVKRLSIDLRTISNKSEQEIAKAINIGGINIQRVATRLTPVNKRPGVGGGVLRNSNTFNPANASNLTLSVGNKAFYAAYNEFGTGSKVRVPDGYKEVAIIHKGRGVRNVNLRPQPFLVPAIEIEKPKLIERIKKIFK